MKKVSSRQFQLNAPKYLKELPITLTKNNIPIAVVIPYKIGEKKEEVISPINIPNPIIPDIAPGGVLSKCEAPMTICRNVTSKQYKIGFMTDEGIQRKDIFLCTIHLQKARSENAEIEEL